MNKTFKLIRFENVENASNVPALPNDTILAESADKAALLFMSQIFKNNRKSRVLGRLTIAHMNGPSVARTTIRKVSRELARSRVNGQCFRYVHKIV